VKKIVILHNRISANATIDDLDILDQVRLVSEALQSLGYETTALPFTQDDPCIIDQLNQLHPVFVFNLVEPVNGEDKNAYIFAPALLELMNIPFSGCGSQTGTIVMNKLAMKRMLLQNGLPTPAYVSAMDHAGFSPDARFILKPVSECTSIGLDSNPIYQFGSIEELTGALAQKKQSTGMTFFAEGYIDGREIRMSIVGSQANPQLLPPVEVTFEQFEQENKPKIYNFTGKWITDSFEFKHTRSTSEFEAKDAELLEHVKQIARRCWETFKMRGYASVDFRIDSAGQPYVVDVNTNPCLTEHPGGIGEASRAAGLGFAELIGKIIPDA
jgi:D-alanine-D-alanine ligase